MIIFIFFTSLFTSFFPFLFVIVTPTAFWSGKCPHFREWVGEWVDLVNTNETESKTSLSFFWWWKCGITVRAETIASSLIQWIALYVVPPAVSPLQTVINQALLWLLKQGSTDLRAFFRSASLWTSVVWRMWLQVWAGKEQKHNVSIFRIHYVYCNDLFAISGWQSWAEYRWQVFLHAITPFLQGKIWL